MKEKKKNFLTLWRLAATFLIVLAIAIVSGCGGGGGSNNNNTSTGFTAEMLDAGPTYYVISSGDDDGTFQETIVISGTGPYVATITEEYFDASDVSQGTETFTVNVTLNPDGTLTATVSGDPSTTILTLTEETATYLYIVGVVDGTDTWDDVWFFTPPTEWLTSGSDTPTGFTAEMLDAGPTYYATSPGDPDGTVQETIVISGTGPYVGTITEEYFDASDVSQGTGTFTVNVTLNPDGTLTATVSGDPSTTILTLTEETATYLYIVGVVDGTDTWDDVWFFTPPEGWL